MEKKDYKKKLEQFSLLLMIISMPWGFSFFTYSTILYGLIWIANKNYLYLGFNHPTHLLPIYYFIHIIGLLYTENISQGLFTLEIRASLLIHPILLSTPKSIELKKLFIFFNTSLYIHCIWLIINYFILNENQTLRDFFISNSELHIPYLGMYLIFSVFIVYYYYSHAKFVTWCICLLTLVLIVLLGAKMAFLNLCLFIIIYIVIEYRNRIAKLLAFFIIITSFIFVFYQNSDIKQRFEGEVFGDKDNSRVRNWNSGLTTINRSPWIGYGTGDVINALQENRPKKSWEYINKYNAHNQYIDIAIAHGAPILVFFLFILTLMFYKGYKSKNWLLMAFVLLFFTSSFTESLLDRNKGVVFLAICSTLLLSKSYNDKNPEKEIAE